MGASSPQFSQQLFQPFFEDTGFSEAASALWAGHSISADGMVGSSCALGIATVFQHGKGSLLVITPTALWAEEIADDLTLFFSSEFFSSVFSPAKDSNNTVLLFPPTVSRDHEPEGALAIADEAFGEKIHVLKQLKHKEGKNIIVVSMPALQQPVPPPALLKERTRVLKVNSRTDLESLRHYLIEGGYHATSAVDLPGEFAVRGYILDLFAPDWMHPIRIEFFNDEIESIRRFDLTTQRSLEKLEEVDLTRLQPDDFKGATLLDYFSHRTPIILVEPSAMTK